MNPAQTAKLARLADYIEPLTSTLCDRASELDGLQMAVAEAAEADAAAHLNEAFNLIEGAVTALEKAVEAIAAARAGKPSPNGLQPREGELIMLTNPGNWGKGATVAEARANLPCSLGDNWIAWSVHPSTYVNNFGQLVRDAGTPEPVELRRSF